MIGSLVPSLPSLLLLLRNCKTPWRWIKVNRARSRVPIHPHSASSPLPLRNRSLVVHFRMQNFQFVEISTRHSKHFPLSLSPSLPRSLSPLSLSSRVTSSVSRTTTSYSAFLMIAAGRGRAAGARTGEGANRSSGGRRDGRGRTRATRWSTICVGKNELTFSRNAPKSTRSLPPASAAPRIAPAHLPIKTFLARLENGPCRNEPWPSSGQLSDPSCPFSWSRLCWWAKT